MSLLRETLPEVLSTTGHSRPREVLRPRDTLFYSHLLFLQYISLLLFGFTYRWACFELKNNILNSDLPTPKKGKSEDSRKKSGDSTKGSEILILFFPYQDLNEPFFHWGIKFYLTLFMTESWELAGLWMNNKKFCCI